MQANWVVAPFTLQQTPFVELAGPGTTVLTLPSNFVGDSPAKDYTIIILQVYVSQASNPLLTVNSMLYWVGTYEELTYLYSYATVTSSGISISIYTPNSRGVFARIAGVFNTAAIELPSAGPGTTVQTYDLISEDSYDVGNCRIAGYKYRLPSSGGFLPQLGLSNIYGFFGDIYFPNGTIYYSNYNYTPFIHPTLSFPGSHCDDRLVYNIGNSVWQAGDHRYNTFIHISSDTDGVYVYLLKKLNFGNVPSGTSPLSLRINGWLRNDLTNSSNQPLIVCVSPIFDSNCPDYWSGFVEDRDASELDNELICRLPSSLRESSVINRSDSCAAMIVCPYQLPLIPIKSDYESELYDRLTDLIGDKIYHASANSTSVFFGAIDIGDNSLAGTIKEGITMLDSTILSYPDENTVWRPQEFAEAYSEFYDFYTYPYILELSNHAVNYLVIKVYLLRGLKRVFDKVFEGITYSNLPSGIVTMNNIIWVFGFEEINNGFVDYTLRNINIDSWTLPNTINITQALRDDNIYYDLDSQWIKGIMPSSGYLYLLIGEGLFKISSSIPSIDILTNVGGACTSLYVDSDYIWIGTDSGVQKMSKSYLSIISTTLTYLNVVGITGNQSHLYVLYIDDGYYIGKYNKSNGEFYSIPIYGLPLINHKSFCIDNAGYICISGNKPSSYNTYRLCIKVYSSDLELVKTIEPSAYTYEDTLSNGSLIPNMYINGERGIWIGPIFDTVSSNLKQWWYSLVSSSYKEVVGIGSNMVGVYPGNSWISIPPIIGA